MQRGLDFHQDFSNSPCGKAVQDEWQLVLELLQGMELRKLFPDKVLISEVVLRSYRMRAGTNTNFPPFRVPLKQMEKITFFFFHNRNEFVGTETTCSSAVQILEQSSLWLAALRLVVQSQRRGHDPDGPLYGRDPRGIFSANGAVTWDQVR